jgi:hypothetical protein
MVHRHIYDRGRTLADILNDKQSLADASAIFQLHGIPFNVKMFKETQDWMEEQAEVERKKTGVNRY